ncbi:hypothetical protein [Escherichia coli]|uniref:hypothetical protein n=1 Tax=Escherichia coli TaxID=562 RepID=UPI0014947AAC|nr:hypothetical protein [Escherichia coli]
MDKLTTDQKLQAARIAADITIAGNDNPPVVSLPLFIQPVIHQLCNYGTRAFLM